MGQEVKGPACRPNLDVSPRRGQIKPSDFKDDDQGKLTYVVKPGDTLSHIMQAAKRFGNLSPGLSLKAIAEDNGIRNINSIRVGQTIVISGGLKVECEGPDASLAEPKVKHETQTRRPVHTVKSGGHHKAPKPVPVTVDEPHDSVSISTPTDARKYVPIWEDPRFSTLGLEEKKEMAFKQAQDLIRLGKFREANDIIEAFIKTGDVGDKKKAASLLFDIGEKLFKDGRYTEAVSVFKRISRSFSGVDIKKPMFEEGQIEPRGSRIFIHNERNAGVGITYDGLGIPELSADLSDCVLIRQRQAEFLIKAERVLGQKLNPFDLKQVGKYFAVISRQGMEKVANELQGYLQAFYVHSQANFPDSFNAVGEIQTIPSNKLGQKVIDCFCYAQITQEIFNRAEVHINGRFMSLFKAAPFEMSYVLVTDDKSVPGDWGAHMMFVVKERSTGKSFLLSNWDTIMIKSDRKEDIIAAFKKYLEERKQPATGFKLAMAEAGGFSLRKVREGRIAIEFTRV